MRFRTYYSGFGTISKNRQPVTLIPTRCRDLHLKQFCLEDIAPAILIILITHIIVAVRWMLIKILSAVINHHGMVTTVVSGGCHSNNNIIRKTDRKIKILRQFRCEDLAGYDRRLPPSRREPLVCCIYFTMDSMTATNSSCVNPEAQIRKPTF